MATKRTKAPTSDRKARIKDITFFLENGEPTTFFSKPVNRSAPVGEQTRLLVTPSLRGGVLSLTVTVEGSARKKKAGKKK